MEQNDVPRSCIYVGLAGDTDPGRFVSAGLLRHRPDGNAWERIDSGLGPMPEVRAILADPKRPGAIMVGTEAGVFSSDDYGNSWNALPLPQQVVWCLVRHPDAHDVILAGCEPCGISESRDGGKTWRELKVDADFPYVTRDAGLPKRVIGIAFDPADRNGIYAGIEVGGVLHTADGGRRWHSLTDGLYVSEDALDVHDVLAGLPAPDSVTIATRIGVFASADRGAHWRSLRVPALREKGSYCRRLLAAGDNPRRLYVGAGNDFDGDRGALFVSSDAGDSWTSCDLAIPLKSTVFALAADPRRADGVWCATKYGGVAWSPMHGPAHPLDPLPKGAGHVFALAAG